jgi:hypothetical protein
LAYAPHVKLPLQGSCITHLADSVLLLGSASSPSCCCWFLGLLVVPSCLCLPFMPLSLLQLIT